MPSVSPNPRLAAILLAAGALAGLCACRDRSIASYRIPKEPDTEAATAPEAAPPGAPAIRWTVPDGWQPQPATDMRQGSFLVSGAGGASADMSVVSFPGTGGDDLANINRWRGQLKLAPVSAEEMPGQVQSLQDPAGQFVFADMAGSDAEKGPVRILGAWLRQPDRVWFFKMMGPSDLVESQRDAFVGFLQSVTLAQAQAGGPALARPGSAPANTNDLPKGAPGANAPLLPAAAAPAMNTIPVQAEGGASLLWQAPGDWQSLPGKGVRRGSYGVGGGAEVAITAFPGDVGGVLANVNRWREQAGLAPVDEAGLGQATAALESNGLHFLVVDAEGGAAPIVAALVPWNGGTWFFKLTGPADAVARARPAFMAFLGTVRAP